MTRIERLEPEAQESFPNGISTSGQRGAMRGRLWLVIGLCAATLSACGGSSPPVVDVNGGGGMSSSSIEEQIINLQNQMTALQQQVDMLESRLPPAK